MTKVEIEFDEAHETFTAILDGVKVGSLEIYRDDEDAQDRPWINGIEVNQELRRQGIGRSLVKAARDQFGCVYASRAPKEFHNDQVGDTRWLSMNGARLVEYCVAKGIMEKEWFINPFAEDRGSFSGFED